MSRIRAVRAIVVVVLAIAGSAFAETIRPVAERDPNPSTSPTVDVERLTVRDFEPFEHLGITDEAVRDWLTAALGRARRAGAPDVHGFTEAELHEVARFLDGLRVHERDDSLGPDESRELMALIRDQKRDRGVSVVALERIAVELGQFYRDHGLFLSVGYVPSQRVDDGVVELVVLPGRLAEVRIDEPLIREAFEPVLGRAVQKQEIEAVLFRLNHLPGMKVQGAFSAGEEVGETRLDLLQINTRQWRGGVGVDNHIDRQVARQRVVAHVARSGLARVGDDMAIGMSTSLDPTGTSHLWARYAAPIFSLRNRWYVELGSNDFSWRPESDTSVLRIDGGGDRLSFGLNRILRASRTRTFGGRLAMTRHELATGGQPNQKLWFGTAAAEARSVLDRQRLVVNGDFEIDLGNFEHSNGKDDVWRARGHFGAWKQLSVPGFEEMQQLSFSAVAQYSGKRLPDSMRLSLGGVHRVRAFDPSDFVADRGIVASLDMRLAPDVFGGRGSLLLFLDGGYGESLTAVPQDALFSAIGLGVDWRLSSRFSTALSWAVPLFDKGLLGSEPGSRFYWTFRYDP